MHIPGSQKDEMNTMKQAQTSDETAVTSRRDFLSGIGKTVGFAAIAGLAEVSPAHDDTTPAVTPSTNSRAEMAYQIRLASAERQHKMPIKSKE